MLDRELLENALEEIKTLRDELILIAQGMDIDVPNYQSLLNLKQYNIVRGKSRTELQKKLVILGLSSMGRSYAHIAATTDAIYDLLNAALYQKPESIEVSDRYIPLKIPEAVKIASHNSAALFGGKSSSKFTMQKTSIMVTLPSDAAENDGHLIHRLADAGVNTFRINTAHDGPETWRAMADIIKKINQDQDQKEMIKIFVDIAGPKIRTGEIRKLDLPIKIGSKRFEKEVLFVTGDQISRGEKVDETTQQISPAQIVVEKKFFNYIKIDDHIKIFGSGGKKGFVTITQLGEGYAKGIIEQKLLIDKDSICMLKKYASPVLNVEKQCDPIRLFIGDHLRITEDPILGSSAFVDDQDMVIDPAVISCSLKGLATFVNISDKIYIDDGKIGLVVVDKGSHEVTAEVIQAKVSGTILKEEKGINFPDSHVKAAAITEPDKENLETVLDFADNLGLSFCQSSKDVRDLQTFLEERGKSHIGIIAKIETKHAIANMPKILEQLLSCEKSGVMIARGDLAVEVGFENLAYIQEELLDICDAAHMPVIWATQVLESQMKSNLPSRAEVTDAAMASRAECVMLNKGAFAVHTIDVLIHILNGMHTLFRKNRQLLNKQTLW